MDISPQAGHLEEEQTLLLRKTPRHQQEGRVPWREGPLEGGHWGSLRPVPWDSMVTMYLARGRRRAGLGGPPLAGEAKEILPLPGREVPQRQAQLQLVGSPCTGTPNISACGPTQLPRRWGLGLTDPSRNRGLGTTKGGRAVVYAHRPSLTEAWPLQPRKDTVREAALRRTCWKQTKQSEGSMQTCTYIFLVPSKVPLQHTPYLSHLKSSPESGEHHQSNSYSSKASVSPSGHI